MMVYRSATNRSSGGESLRYDGGALALYPTLQELIRQTGYQDGKGLRIQAFKEAAEVSHAVF
jgi:hypothetical protein